MGTLKQDLTHAVRVLLKSRGFAVACLAVLALGIGANTAIFSVVNAVLLKPLPFPEADRLMYVLHKPPQKSFPGIQYFSVSPANYLDWRAQNHVFESMAAFGGGSKNLTGVDRPESVKGSRVEPSFFDVVRAHAELGRTFVPEEGQPGHEKVAMVSHKFWETRLGGDRGAIGRILKLDGDNYTLVGVMPEAFQFAAWEPTNVDLWTPLAWDAKQRAVRDNHNFLVIARLKPGVDVRRAQAEMDAISKRLEIQYPEADSGWGAGVLPLREDLFGQVRTALIILLGAVAFVLLIACANVANLVMARNLSRRKEMAIRAALGASRSRALRQILTETVLLAVSGGALGLFVARGGIELIKAFLARELPPGVDIEVDGWVLAFTLGVSLLTGIVAGLAPALRSSKTDLNDALKQGLGRTDSDASGGGTRAWLVVAEVALSLVLLVGAGLMIRTLWTLRQVDPGLDARNVLTVDVFIPREKYQPQQQVQFYENVLQRVRSLPGVIAAASIDSLPLDRGGSQQPVVIEGRPAERFAEQPEVGVRVTTPGYLRAMGIPLRRGRDFTDADRSGKPNVVLISEAMARHFWPNQDPIGRRLTLSFAPDRVRQVVGVVANVKERGLDAREPLDTLYEPLAQTPVFYQSLVVRTSVPPRELTAAVTRAVHEVDREQPVQDVRTMQELVDKSLSQRRFNMMLLAAFAGLALLLATVGIYSVLAYTVRRRVREIGVRMALGAGAADVLRLVVREGMRPALIGVALGLFGAVALSSVLTKIVYGVSPWDPPTFAAVATLLLLVALAACLAPAWRATRVDPIRVLRDE